MSQLYVGSICLTDIPEQKKVIGRNGKIYVNVTLWVNDSPDQYGNIGSIHVSQMKEEREKGEKRCYVGNFKIPVVATANGSTSNTPQQVSQDLTNDDSAWNEFLSR